MRVAILEKQELDDNVVVDVVLDLDGVEEFLQNAFNAHDKLIARLRKLLDAYPELVKVVLNDDNEYEIQFYRYMLIQKLERDKLDINILSFERDLKRANFYCAQSTHRNQWKIFRLRKNVENKKSKKRKTISNTPEDVCDNILNSNTHSGKLLREYVREYPNLVQVVLGEDDEYEVHIADINAKELVTIQYGLRYVGYCCPRQKRYKTHLKIWKKKQKK